MLIFVIFINISTCVFYAQAHSFESRKSVLDHDIVDFPYLDNINDDLVIVPSELTMHRDYNPIIEDLENHAMFDPNNFYDQLNYNPELYPKIVKLNTVSTQTSRPTNQSNLEGLQPGLAKLLSQVLIFSDNQKHTSESTFITNTGKKTESNIILNALTVTTKEITTFPLTFTVVKYVNNKIPSVIHIQNENKISFGQSIFEKVQDELHMQKIGILAIIIVLLFAAILIIYYCIIKRYTIICTCFNERLCLQKTQKEENNFESNNKDAGSKNIKDPQTDNGVLVDRSAEAASAKKQYDEKIEKLKREKEAAETEDEKNKIEAKIQEENRNLEVAAEKISKICPCPFGFYWYQVSGGWICGGGSHFVSDEQLKNLEKP